MSTLNAHLPTNSAVSWLSLYEAPEPAPRSKTATEKFWDENGLAWDGDLPYIPRPTSR